MTSLSFFTRDIHRFKRDDLLKFLGRTIFLTPSLLLWNDHLNVWILDGGGGPNRPFLVGAQRPSSSPKPSSFPRPFLLIRRPRRKVSKRTFKKKGQGQRDKLRLTSIGSSVIATSLFCWLGTFTIPVKCTNGDELFPHHFLQMYTKNFLQKVPLLDRHLWAVLSCKQTGRTMLNKANRQKGTDKSHGQTHTRLWHYTPGFIIERHVLPLVGMTNPVLPLDKEVPILQSRLELGVSHTSLSDSFLARKL